MTMAQIFVGFISTTDCKLLVLKLVWYSIYIHWNSSPQANPMA